MCDMYVNILKFHIGSLNIQLTTSIVNNMVVVKVLSDCKSQNCSAC